MAPKKAHHHKSPAATAAAKSADNDDVVLKFPRTPHVADLSGNISRDDLVLGPGEVKAMFLSGQLVACEEKVDGANLGISLAPPPPSPSRNTPVSTGCTGCTGGRRQLRFQHRGRWIASTSEPQYAKLDAWAQRHYDALLRVLGDDGRRVLYGEWMVARHSAAYDKLPDWFLAFDVFDTAEGKFLSRSQRDRLLAGTGIRCVRTVHCGRFEGLQQLVDVLMAARSAFSTQESPVEGLYMRVDDEESGFLQHRAKLVHPTFIQAIEDSGVHWAKRAMICNSVRPDQWPIEEEGEE